MVSGCLDKRFSTLVSLLRDRFSPRDKEIVYQQLMTHKKKPDQSWKDSAQEIEVFSMKAYLGMEERYRESMAAKIFVEDVVDERVCRKRRKAPPSPSMRLSKMPGWLRQMNFESLEWQEYDLENKDKSQKKSDKSQKRINLIRVWHKFV